MRSHPLPDSRSILAGRAFCRTVDVNWQQTRLLGELVMLRQCERDRERERAKAVHKTRRGRGEWEGKGIKAGEAVEDLELCLAAVRPGALTTTATVRNRLRNPERERGGERRTRREGATPLSSGLRREERGQCGAGWGQRSGSRTVVGLVRALSRQAEVLGLNRRELRELDVERLQVRAGNLLVELLGQDVHANRVGLLLVVEEQDLGEDLLRRDGEVSQMRECG